jgi:tetratricopeptide (TPR) repeat protein
MRLVVRTGIALLLALISLAAAAQWGPDGKPLSNPFRKPSPQDESPVRAVAPDPLDRAFPQGKPRVSSPWLDTEMRSFTKLLKSGKYDLMVGPIRTEGYAVDRISRSLILAELTRELAARKLRVPNPVALSRAMGENRRRFELGEYISMARTLGVEKIVVVGLAHDRLGHLKASVGILEAKRVGAFTPKELPEFDLGAGQHPSAIAQVIAPAVLEALALPGKAPARRQATVAAKRALPASPSAAMAVKADDVVGRAIAMQLIASLAPYWPERSGERLFEQALIAAQALPPKHPYSALFVARAWRYLEARETALGALGDSTAPEARAYREFLNGNLPDFGKALAEVKDELMRSLLEIDLKVMQTTYQHPDAKDPSPSLDAFAAKYPAWAPLLQRRLEDLDWWASGDPTLAKRLLDRDLELPGEQLDRQIAGMRLTGEQPGAAALVKLALHHVERARREHRAVAACLSVFQPCVAGAYVDLLEAIAISDPIRELYRLVKIQALPAEARDLAEALKPELEGHPAMLALQAGAQLALYQKLPASQRDSAIAELTRLASAAALLEQGQSPTSFDALLVLGVPSKSSAPFLSAYQFDLPARPYWYVVPESQYQVSGGPSDPKPYRDLLRSQVAASVMNLGAVRHLLEEEASKREVREVLEKRFKGHPGRADLLQALAESPAERGRLSEAARAERPDRWDSYAEQGARLIDEQGDYEAAAAMYGKYPGFSDPSHYDAVDLSNQAYAAGSVFFWQGRLEETRRFYDIAAKLNTGSAASLASEQRLAQLDRKYAAMLNAARNRGQRYHDAYAWRDFLSWLFVLENENVAWTGFTQLHDKFDNPQVWLAADVALRMKGGDWESQKRWLLTEPYKSSRSEGTAHGVRLALMLNAIDRTPAPDLVSTLRELAGPPNTGVEKFMVLRPPSGGRGSVGYPRSAFRAKDRAPVREGTLAESEFIYFADAYVELRRGNFKAAVERFDKMAQFYAVEGSPQHGLPGFALPYFAWASAKAGDSLGLEAFVRSLPEGRARDFDRGLALAFFAGLRGERDIAEKYLLLAFRHRPFTDKRPIFTEYQWTEACEWLYIATGEKRYLTLALDWAHRYQEVMPVSAWAYAFEARYSTDEQQRLRATAIALYLDPRSEYLKSVPAALRKRAEQWFAANNPFKARRPGKDDQARAIPGTRNTLLQSAGGTS